MIYEKYGTYDVRFSEDEGSLQSGIRPVIIIQNDLGNKYSPTVLVLPLTSKLKHTAQATHTLIDCDKENGLSKKSMVLGEQIQTINKSAIVKKRGKITDRNIQKQVFQCFINAAAYGKDDVDAMEIVY